MSKLFEAKVYLAAEQLRALELMAARTGRSKSEIARAAIASFLSADAPDQLEAALGRRLDRIVRQLERVERDLSISNEAHGLFIKAWLTATPAVPEGARMAVEAKGRERYLGFIEALGRRLAAGRSLRAEVLEERSAGDG